MGRKTRRWDGERESAADTRFFNLREAGYEGPIDENGFPVTKGRHAKILRRLAKRRNRKVGW
jgi:hypothetical protein